jgi:hypothetical protein
VLVILLDGEPEWRLFRTVLPKPAPTMPAMKADRARYEEGLDYRKVRMGKVRAYT